MNYLLHPTRRILLLTALLTALLLVGRRPVYAQVIVPDPGAASCELTPDCKESRYRFVAGQGQEFLRWEARGDLKLLTPPADNPAFACSVGYGKGRITAYYYELRRNGVCGEKCPDTLFQQVSYDVFKSFKSPTPIYGPACAVAGQEVTYRVEPLLTDWPHRQAGIGTDSYYWSGFPPGAAVGFAGDSSTITLVLAADQPAFRLRCQVGRCNQEIELPVTPAAPVPALAVTSSCRPTSATGPFTLVVDAVAGVTYRIQLPATWQVVPAGLTTSGITPLVSGPLAIDITPDRNGGDVMVVATNPGGCAPAISAYRLNRQLVSGSGAGTQSLTNPGCFANGSATSINMTLTNAPSNTLFRWKLPTAPSGWSITTAGAELVDAANNIWRSGATVAIQAPAGHSGGEFKVNADNCPSAVLEEVKRTVNVIGSLTCTGTYTIQRGIQLLGPPLVYFNRTFSVTSPTAGCIPDNVSGAFIYTWQQLDPTTGTVLQTRTSDINQVTFLADVLPVLGARVKVTILDPVSCLSISVDQLNRRPAPGPGGVTPKTAAEASRLAAEAVTVSPNPAGDLLRVGLPAGTMATLILRDLTGRVVREVTAQRATPVLSVADLPTGAYTLRAVLNTGQVVNRTVQVQH